MTPTTGGIDSERLVERLRESWRERHDAGAASPDCAKPERVWSAVCGEAPREEARRLLLHAAGCPACGTALRLAREISAASGVAVANPARAGIPWYGWAAAAAAAAALLSLPLWLPSGEQPDASAYRDQGAEAIRSLVPDGEAMPREGFLLRWTPGPPGTRYSVRVTQADLTPVASTQALEGAEWHVPAEAFAGLPAESLLYWRVEAHLPEGGESTSEAFRARLQ
jgi:hypothetical protein